MADQTTEAPQRPAAAPIPTIVRVNLLPEEFVQGRAFKKAKYNALCAGIAVLILVMLGVAGSMFLKHQAQSKLNAATAQTSQFTAKVNSFTPVVNQYKDADTAQDFLYVAMGRQIRFDNYWAAVTRTLPGHVTLSSIQMVNTSYSSSGGQYVGTLSISGKANSISTVGALVDALNSAPGTDYTWVAGVSGTPKSGYTFTANANLTPKAFSNCYPAPSSIEQQILHHKPSPSGINAAPSCGGTQ